MLGLKDGDGFFVAPAVLVDAHIQTCSGNWQHNKYIFFEERLQTEAVTAAAALK